MRIAAAAPIHGEYLWPDAQRLRLFGIAAGRHKFQNGAPHWIHRRHEAVSQARQGFHIAGLIGRIAKRLPKLIDGRVETMFEVTGSSSGPKSAAKIFTSHQIAGPLQQAR